jgi:hypothetical protein
VKILYGRVHDTCPECGEEILVAPMSAFMHQLEASGYAGTAPVTVHKMPLCEAVRSRTDRAWKEITRAAEDAMDEARANEVAEQNAARARRQKGNAPKPHTEK